jgi:hypothetical protein
MRKYQTSLLAGVAALALIAGAGVASAQQSKEHTGGSQATSSPAGQSMSRQGSQAQEKSKGTENQAQEKSRSNETQAQQSGKTDTDRTAQTGKENKASTDRTAQSGKENLNGQESQKMGKRGERAEHMNRGSKSSRQAERQNTLKGLRGDTTKPMQGENEKSSTTNNKSGTSNQAQDRGSSTQRGTESTQRGTESSQGSDRVNGGTESRSSSSTEVRGGSVNLTEQQRTEIKTTVIQGHNAPRVGHVDFDVRVGTAVPRGKIHVVPVPETLVRIEPRWRGFMYFVYEDEVVIVDPHDYKIVAVVPV